MRNLILGLGLVALSANAALGCDVCGGSGVGNMMGIVPQFGNHFVGLRYQFSGFNSRHAPSLLSEGVNGSSREAFHSMELMGRYYVHPRIQLLAFVPYRLNLQTTDTRSYEGKGLGDISLMGNFLLVNTGDSLGRKLRHTLMVGAGLKMATGAYRQTDHGLRLHPNLQPGSGSWDALFNLQYTVRLKQWGVSLQGMYRLNTANPEGFRSGDRIMGNFLIYHWSTKGRWNVMPSIGVAVDHARKERLDDRVYLLSGGTDLRATAELQVFHGQWGIGAGCRLPLHHSLANGTVTPAPQWMASLVFLL